MLNDGIKVTLSTSQTFIDWRDTHIPGLERYVNKIHGNTYYDY